MITLLIAALRRRNAERRSRARLRALLIKDDRLLEDMGLRRADIAESLCLPLSLNARDHADRLSARSLALDQLR